MRSTPFAGTKAQTKQANLYQRSLLLIIALSLSLGTTPVSWSQVVADPNAPTSQRPEITHPGNTNNVPVVNITAPSQSGVSRNDYTQFDVQQQGVILNNSQQNTNTQLGGWIQGNPNLGNAPARIILNEVTSGNPSMLRGYVEVGGNRAEVIIANPAGISIEGGGFINASGVTLTTGKPQFNATGHLESYRVRGGRIIINGQSGQGLDTSTADYTRIIARAVEINAGLWANDLAITTSTGTIAHSGQPIQLTVEDASGKPLYAIDVAQLGGMYAGKIRLIGTEHGVGVRNAGHVGASAGQVTVTADGQLLNTGAINSTVNSTHTANPAHAGIQIATTGDITNLGAIYSQGDLTLQSNGQLTNSATTDKTATIAALGNTTLTAQNITNTQDALIASGMNSDGQFTTSTSTNAPQGNLTLQAAQTIANQGSILSANNTHLQSQLLTNTAIGNIHTGDNLSVQTQLLTNQGTLAASGNATINTQLLTNASKIISAKNLALQAATINNTSGLISGTQVTISDQNSTQAPAINTLNNTSGTIIAGNALNITAANLTNATGKLLSEGDLTLQLAGNHTNATDSQIIANKNLNLQVDGTLTNFGELLAGQTAAITATDIDNQTSGQISAATTKLTTQSTAPPGTLTGTVTNRGLIDGEHTRITTGQLTNLGTGRIYGTHLAIKANTLTNRDETITVGGSSTTTSGTIAARQRLDIGVTTLKNHNNAIIYSGGDIVIGGELVLDANPLAQGKATLVQNDGAIIEAAGNLYITANDIENLNSQFVSQEILQSTQQIFVHILADGTIVSNEGVYYFKERNNQTHTVERYFEVSSILQARSALGESAHYFMLLPSQNYTESQCTQIYGLGGIPDPAISILGQLNTTTYAPEHPVWQILGVTAPAPIPTDSLGNTCDGITYCGASSPEYAQYATWNTSSQVSYQTLNTRITHFNADFESRKVNVETLREYTQSDYQTEVLASNPGQLLSGGNMVLDANTLNDKSRIIAGGTLVATNLANINADGKDYTTKDGTQINTMRTASGRDWSAPADYNTRSGDTLFSLNVTKHQQNTTPTGTGTQIDGTMAVQVPGGQIHTTPPNLHIPSGSLYKLNPGTGSNYLIETDPKFTNYGTWLSSDHMLGLLGLNPALIQKRLGDGYYEQQLIREQIGKLTGYRYLAGYQSDEEQYKALMNAGVEFALTYSLSPGIALTPAQMKNLTSDIVWLVSKDITLPNGQTETVLVPQVYARSGASMITTQGTLLSASNVYIGNSQNNPSSTKPNLLNTATIAAQEGLFVDVNHLQNLGGQLHGNNVALQAQTDIDNIGGIISADNSITMAAGRDINIASTVTQGRDTHGSTNNIGNTGVVYLSGNKAQDNNGQIHIQAGRDINLNAAYIGNNANSGSAGIDNTTQANTSSTTLIAGRNIDIGTVTTEQTHAVAFDAKNTLYQSSRTDTGSQINTRGDVNLMASNDLTLRGASVTSEQGNINAAGNTINIEAAQSATSNASSYYASFKGTLSSKSYDRRYTNSQTELTGTSLSAENIHLNATGDLNITASNVVATQDVNLVSQQGNITVKSGTTLHDSDTYERVKRSGFLGGGGGIGFTVGKQRTTTTQDNVTTSAQGATVGSLEGNVNILARQGSYTQTGSDVLALTGDINVVAQDIAITEARETSHNIQTYDFKQTGITVSVSSPLISAVQTAQQMSDASDKTSNGRMQALAAGAAALNTYNNLDAITGSLANMAQGGNPLGDISQGGGGMNVSLSMGSSKAQSRSEDISNTAKGSGMSAGGNINLVATGRNDGKTQQPSYTGGNIVIQGSDITATNNVNLIANNQIDILAASNTSDQTSSNKSSSSSLGVSFGAGGFGVSASASRSKGSGNGQDQSWTVSHINAGNTTTIVSGGDVNIIGSQVAGNTVKADIGGNLNIESLQDTSSSHNESKSSSGSISIGAGSISGSISASKAKADGSYASVNEYAGIMAGDGGFDITVAGNTDLKGAIIASTQNAINNNQNQLTTGSLTTSDIQNSSAYDAKGSSIGLSTSLGGNSAGFGKESGSDSSTTLSGISGGNISGTITITNEAEQQRLTGQTAQEAIDTINSDVLTGQSANGIDKGWDTQELLGDVQAQAEITALFGQQASKSVGDYATEKMAAILKETAALQSQPDSPEKAQRLAELQADYDNWKEGGAYRVLAHTVIGGLTGDLSGALGAGSTSLAAGYINDITKDLPPGVKEAVGAGLSAGLGAIVGGNAGATAAFNQDTNNRQIHALETAKLDEEAQKWYGEIVKGACTADEMSIGACTIQIKDPSQLSGILRDANLALVDSQSKAQLEEQYGKNGNLGVLQAAIDRLQNNPNSGKDIPGSEVSFYLHEDGVYRGGPAYSGQKPSYVETQKYFTATDTLLADREINHPIYNPTLKIQGIEPVIIEDLLIGGGGALKGLWSLGKAATGWGAEKVVIRHGATNVTPLGFQSESQFLTATQELQNTLKAMGIDDAVVGVRGSSVTGSSARKGTQFHADSDIDIFIESAQLTATQTSSKNIPGFVHPNRIMNSNPALKAWSEKWSQILERSITPGAFKPGTVPIEPTIVVK